MRSTTALLLLAMLAASAAAAPPSERREALLHLLKHDCGSCHGIRLTGGLGPPLTPAALAGKPGEALAATILDGRPGTPMAPWRPFLTREEAAWLVEVLKRGAADAPAR